MSGDYRRLLPSVDAVLDSEPVRALTGVRREVVVYLIRDAIARIRGSISDHTKRESLVEMVSRDVCKRVDELRMGTVRVINATGVVLHTNLGRAVLSEKASEAVQVAAEHYTDLEFDLVSGVRGSRYRRAGGLLRALTGAEDALVVNNNAAAVWLALNTMAAGKQVIVSRGQLVEIGDSFRLPQIMELSGASLVEVGTTNRTYLSDYEGAIGEQTGLLLNVHPSNFRVVGFTAEVSIGDLVALGRERSLPVLFDVGSGLLMDAGVDSDEPEVRSLIDAGVDVVTFSGDKLLGGPQSGLIVGRTEFVGRMKRNPMLRALRVDKLTLAALEATLTAYVGSEGAKGLPTVQGLTIDYHQLRQKAEWLADQIKTQASAGVRISVIDGISSAGGGSLPGYDLRSCLVKVECEGASGNKVGSLLRCSKPPVIVRIDEDAVYIDPRTVSERETGELVSAVVSVVGSWRRDQ